MLSKVAVKTIKYNIALKMRYLTKSENCTLNQKDQKKNLNIRKFIIHRFLNVR